MNDPKSFLLFHPALPLPQVASFMGYTNARCHQIVRNNICRSALYGGEHQRRVRRYCPSFEDKIVKFPERDRHHVILEPEGLDTEEIYASGLGNSLPVEIQIEVVRSVKGLEEARNHAAGLCH